MNGKNSLDHSVDLGALFRAVEAVRALILGHGGDLKIVGLAEGGVEVAFFGACRACPNLAMTFIGPVRTALMQVPGVVRVESADVHAGPRALARMARLLGAHPFPE